ncbi:MAG: VOC family protein [Chloroflexota bacterium]
MMKEERRVAFSQLEHITIAIKDMEEAVKFYSSLGIGPFTPPSGHSFASRTLRGKPLGSTKIIVREAKIGSVVLQLVQHVEGEGILKEFIDKKGQGVQHLGFVVGDINREEGKLVKLGLKVTQRGRREDGSGYTFFDTEKQGGVVLEIKQD